MTKSDLYAQNVKLTRELDRKSWAEDLYCGKIKELREKLKELEDEIDKKNKEIEELKATVDRQNKLLTEKELYEKKSKETAPTGVPAIDATVDRLIKLEAKFEAKENPYFF
jgi:predicted RNase H-like nuclease (RuvC/YqgF family)